MTRVFFAVWRFLAGLERPSRRANARRLRERGEDADSLVIRQATADDVTALTGLHVKTWNATYAPLLIKGPSEKIRETQWRQKFAQRFLSEGVE